MTHTTPLDYASWRTSTLGHVTEELERGAVLGLLPPLAGRDVVDVGCGDGTYALAAAAAGARVVGIDPSERALAVARRRAADARQVIDLREGRAEALPLATASCDVVLAVTVLCFVGDARAAVAEMARVLRPGGVAVLGELAWPSAWATWRRVKGWLGSPTWREARFRSRGEIEDLLRGAGLRPESARGAAFYPPVGWMARLLAPLDRRLGRQWTLGAAFVAVRASRPALPGASPEPLD